MRALLCLSSLFPPRTGRAALGQEWVRKSCLDRSRWTQLRFCANSSSLRSFPGEHVKTSMSWFTNRSKQGQMLIPKPWEEMLAT